MPDCTIIITSWNTRKLLLDCIASAYSSIRRSSFEIYVVDNGSSDGSVEAVKNNYPDVRVIANQTNTGFARANNMALKRMKGRFAVLLNSDTILKDGALEFLFDFMERNPRAGVCGPQLLFEDGTKQTSYGTFPTLLDDFGGRTIVRLFRMGKRRDEGASFKDPVDGPFEVDFIIGACMVVRKMAIDRVGVLDEDYFFCYEEMDWCRRMKEAGWHVFHHPNVEIFHLRSKSIENVNLRARAESWRSRYIFFEKGLRLSTWSARGLLALGFALTVYRFLGYTLMNMLTLFALRRLRARWTMFGYLLLWHIRGMPVSMCLPR